jgi:general secretion pathway protein G
VRASFQESVKEISGGKMRRAFLAVFVAGLTLAFGQSDLQAQVRAKEEQLKNTLFRLRVAIDKYASDHKKAAQTPADLVESHYLPEIPIDPMTGSKTTWRFIMESPENAIDKSAPGLFDVRSGSTKTSLGGVRYSDW